MAFLRDRWPWIQTFINACVSLPKACMRDSNIVKCVQAASCQKQQSCLAQAMPLWMYGLSDYSDMAYVE